MHAIRAEETSTVLSCLVSSYPLFHQYLPRSGNVALSYTSPKAPLHEYSLSNALWSLVFADKSPSISMTLDEHKRFEGRYAYWHAIP